MSYFFRNPKTRQEIRDNKALAQEAKEVHEEFGVGIKVRRTDLPTAWDDLPKSSAGDRSWKKRRRFQWREFDSEYKKR